MKELYKATFSHLHASGRSIREEKNMRIKHWRKGLVIGVAAAALMATAAGAVNAATDGALVDYITFSIKGDIKDKTVNPDGSTSFKAKASDGTDITVTYPGEEGGKLATLTPKEGGDAAPRLGIEVGE